MKTYPRSAYDKVGGLVYFARMLDKIRLMAEGKLPPDYHKNLGKGFDGRCTRFLHVDYNELRDQVLKRGSGEDILQGCFEKGRKPSEEEILIWNNFMVKRAWKDEASPELEKYKASSGLSDRTDIQTLFDYYEVDEGRKK